MSPVAPANDGVGRAARGARGGIVVLVSGVGRTTWALKGNNSPDLPRGDQTGVPELPGLKVMRCGLEPSAFITYTLKPFVVSRFEINAISEPSGL